MMLVQDRQQICAQHQLVPAISVGLSADVVVVAIGTPEQVAERIAEFEEAGVDLLLLQFSPQLEEMEHFSKLVIKSDRKVLAPAVV